MPFRMSECVKGSPFKFVQAEKYFGRYAAATPLNNPVRVYAPV